MQQEHESRTRIAVCTSVHAPSDARVVFREARALAERYDVHVYHFEAGPDRPLLPVRGIEFHALPHPGGRLARMLKAGSLIRRAVAEGADVVIAHDPELLPWLAARASVGTPTTIYDAHEDYPSMIRAKGWLPSWARGAVSAWFDREELRLIRRLDLVLVADEHLAARFANSRGGPVLVRNYPPLDLFFAGTPAGTRAPGMVYVGGVTDERGAPVMLRVLEGVRASVPDATLTIIGRAPHGDALEHLSAAPGVTVLGEVAYPEIAPVLASARLGLALLQDTPKHRRNVPSKIFDYMACATPYLASDFENIRGAASSGGVLVDPADEAAIVREAVRVLTDETLATALGTAGRAEVEDRRSFELEAQRLRGRLEGVPSHPRHSAGTPGPAGS